MKETGSVGDSSPVTLENSLLVLLLSRLHFPLVKTLLCLPSISRGVFYDVEGRVSESR